MKRHGIVIPEPDRWIHFWKGVDKDNLQELSKDITEKYDKKRRSEIVLFVSSIGGDVDASIAFYHFIKFSKIKLVCIGLGEIASCGLIIFLAGQRRYVLPDTSCYFHDGTVTTGAKAIPRKEFDACGIRHAQEIDHFYDVVSAETRLSHSKVVQLDSTCTVMKAEEMVRSGLANRIISKPVPKARVYMTRNRRVRLRAVK